jgi:hypothetical protein
MDPFMDKSDSESEVGKISNDMTMTRALWMHNLFKYTDMWCTNTGLPQVLTADVYWNIYVCGQSHKSEISHKYI